MGVFLNTGLISKGQSQAGSCHSRSQISSNIRICSPEFDSGFFKFLTADIPQHGIIGTENKFIGFCIF